MPRTQHYPSKAEKAAAQKEEAKAAKAKTAADERAAVEQAAMAVRQGKADKGLKAEADVAVKLAADKETAQSKVDAATALVRMARQQPGQGHFNAGTNKGWPDIQGGTASAIKVAPEVLTSWKGGGYKGEGTFQPSKSGAWAVHIEPGDHTILIHLKA